MVCNLIIWRHLSSAVRSWQQALKLIWNRYERYFWFVLPLTWQMKTPVLTFFFFLSKLLVSTHCCPKFATLPHFYAASLPKQIIFNNSYHTFACLNLSDALAATDATLVIDTFSSLFFFFFVIHLSYLCLLVTVLLFVRLLLSTRMWKSDVILRLRRVDASTLTFHVIYAINNSFKEK